MNEEWKDILCESLEVKKNPKYEMIQVETEKNLYVPEESEEEKARRKKSQDLHSLSTKLYDREQNSLCFLVIGGIFLIIGILFIFMSLKRENNVLIGIDVGSLAFYIMILSLAGGGIAFLYGLIRFLVAFFQRKSVIAEINSL